MTRGLGYRTESRRCSISTNFWDATTIQEQADLLPLSIPSDILTFSRLRSTR